MKNMNQLRYLHLIITMNLIILLLYFWVSTGPALAATTPPISSLFGDNFRTGEATAPLLSTTSTYDFEVPYASSLGSSSIKLGLSMVEYRQIDIASFQFIVYDLKDNIPIQSNSTHANFQVYISSPPSRTTRVKVRYMACPTFLLSSNFQMYTRVLALGTLTTSYTSGSYSFGATLNTTGSYGQTIWITSIYAAPNFQLSAGFSPTMLLITYRYVVNLKLTIIFVNGIIASASGYTLYYFVGWPLRNPYEAQSLQSNTIWQDLSHVICGLDHFAADTTSQISYAIWIAGRTAFVQTTMPFASPWAYSLCFIAAAKLCPTTHPYYEEESDLCTDACQTSENIDYLCLPCPNHCQQCSSTTYCSKCAFPYYLRSDHLCYSSCLDGTYPNNTSYTCDSCPEGCATCTSLVLCQSCLSSYFLKSFPSTYFGPVVCHTCMLGQGVISGCTNTHGCLEVTYYNPQDLLGTCISCSSQFTLKYSSCQCRQENYILAGSYCTSTAGCISTTIVSGIVRCQFCNFTGHFLYNSTSSLCYCKQGYSQQGLTCQEICGDGIVIAAECDDGNTEDGDGCSSKCEIEPQYRCSTSNSLPSACQFVFSDIQVTLIKMERVDRQNKAAFTFRFQPNLALLNSFDINTLFSINFSGSNFGNVTWTYVNGNLIATGDFSSDLQGKIATANFTFNQLHIKHQPLILNFTVEGSNTKLVYIQSTEKIQIFRDIFLGIACGGLFVLFVGSWLHKMAGVELVHSLQIIYYLHFAFKDYTMPISSLQSLSLVAFNDLHWQVDSQNVKINQGYQKIPFSAQYTEFTIIFLTIPHLISLIGLIVYVLISFSASTEIKNSILNFIRKIYHGFTFPITLGFFSPFLLARATLSLRGTLSSQTFPIQIICLASMVIFIVTSTVLSHELKFLFFGFRSVEERRSFEFKLAKRCYIPLYGIYWVVMTVLLWMWIKFGVSLYEFPMLVISILMILFLIKFRLYLGIVDTIGTIFNFLLQISVMLFLQLRNQGVISSSFEADLNVCLGIIVLCLACFIFSLTRLLLVCFCQEEKQIAELVQNHDKKKEKTMIDQQQSNMKEMIRCFLSTNNSKEESLLNGPRQKQRQYQKLASKRVIDPEQKKIMDKIRKTFKKRENQQRIVREEIES